MSAPGPMLASLRGHITFTCVSLRILGFRIWGGDAYRTNRTVLGEEHADRLFGNMSRHIGYKQVRGLEYFI